MLDRYVGRYSGRNSADTLTVEYRSSVSGLSVECRWSIGRLSYNINQKFRLSVSKLRLSVSDLIYTHYAWIMCANSVFQIWCFIGLAGPIFLFPVCDERP